MSSQPREALERFYCTSEMSGSTPDELRAGSAKLMAHFTDPAVSRPPTPLSMTGRRDAAARQYALDAQWFASTAQPKAPKRYGEQ